MDVTNKRVYEKLFELAKVGFDEKAVKFLDVCELSDYDSVMELERCSKQNYFMERCSTYYLQKTGNAVSPGTILKLEKLVDGLRNASAMNVNVKEICDAVVCAADTPKTYKLMELLKKQEKNISRFAQGTRYDPTLKKFALWLKIRVGKEAYEVLSETLPLPDPETLRKELHMFPDAEAATIQVNGLIQHLKNYNCEPSEWVVALSEDDTGMVNRIQYDSTTGQMIGFVAPLDPKTGMPKPNVFPATTINDVRSAFRTQPKARLLKVIMATPLNNKAPPFPLYIIGTNGKGSYNDVKQRILYLKQILEANGIKVLSFATDADSRPLKFMRQSISLGKLYENARFESLRGLLFANMNVDMFFLQDLFHIISKLRTRLLNSICPLEIGNHVISLGQFRFLLQDFDELRRILRPSDLARNDKMNVQAGINLFDASVIAKAANQPGIYLLLTVMKGFFEAFDSDTLSVSERLYKAWSFLFAVRAWRNDLSSDSSKSLNASITSQTYLCIEINCHAILMLYIYLKDNNCLQIFNCLYQMMSQSCEDFFRKLRGFSSMGSTMINFDMLEVLQRIKKIVALYTLEHDLKDIVTFPRQRIRLAKERTVENLSDEEIFESILKAKNDIIPQLEAIGVKIDTNKSFAFCKIKQGKDTQDYEENYDGNEDENNDEETLGETEQKEDKENKKLSAVKGLFEPLDDFTFVKKYFRNDAEVHSVHMTRNDQMYFYVHQGDEQLKVRKDQVINLYNNPDIISTDRTKGRFHMSNKSNLMPDVDTIAEVTKMETLGITEWIIIDGFQGICRISEFKRIRLPASSETNKKQKKMTQKQSIFSCWRAELTELNLQTIGMQLAYYFVDDNGTLQTANVPIELARQFISISKYKLHVPAPKLESDGSITVNLNILRSYVVVNPQNPITGDFDLTSKKKIKIEKDRQVRKTDKRRETQRRKKKVINKKEKQNVSENNGTSVIMSKTPTKKKRDTVEDKSTKNSKRKKAHPGMTESGVRVAEEKTTKRQKKRK